MDISITKTIRDNFVEELQDSIQGRKTSFPFIVNPLPHKSLVLNGETFQTIVVGGSKGKVAHVKKEGGKIVTISHEEKDQPKFDSVNGFLDYLDNKLHINTKILAVDFAFALSPILDGGVLDGILLHGSKEHLFKGLVGKQIGKTISEYFLKRRGQEVIVSCANDTVCLLLSGLTKYKKENLACGVLGTGMNAAFFLNDNECVNLESANFNKFDQSEEGKVIDKNSMIPGAALLEKETTGAYLYQHFNLIIEKENIDFKPLRSTLELKNLSHQSIPRVSKIANDLLDRSASYISAQITGITEFKKRDMVFVMDGSFFWEESYKKRVDELLPQLTNFNIEIVEIKNNTVLGPAYLVI